MIKNNYPGIKLVVSYADTEQNHAGTIYQASNWIYLGKVKSTESWFINGRWMKRRNAWGYIQDKRRKGEIVNFESRPAFDKHKYVYVMDRNILEQIEPLRKPYPKRELCGQGEIDNAPGTNPETAGASPSCPLSNE